MTIRALPVISDKMYLRDLYKDAKAAEGDCDYEDAAWVMVRQATEGDDRQRAQMIPERTDEIRPDGTMLRKSSSVAATHDLHAFEIYSCLCDTGNIVGADGKTPLFKFKDNGDYRQVDMSFADFQKKYSMLPSSVIYAMRIAVLKINPDWDLWGIVAANSDEDEPEGEA